MSKQTLRVNLYEIVSREIEAGLKGGYNKARDYCEETSPEGFERVCLEQQFNYIMTNLCEVLEFGPFNEEDDDA